MATVDYDDDGLYGVQAAGYGMADPDQPEGRRARTLKYVNGAGALTSVLLVLGLAVWGYKLAVRDVRGVPVVRALEGPARIAPEDPGGELAQHQGLAVNAIAAEGTAAAPADRLTLAPRPTELAPGDQPVAGLTLAGATPPAALPPGLTAPEPPAPLPADLAAKPLAEPLPDGPGNLATEGEEGPAELAATPLPTTTPAAAVSAAGTDGLAGAAPMVRPRPRPERIATAAVPASAPIAAADRDAIAEAAAAAVAAALAGEDVSSANAPGAAPAEAAPLAPVAPAEEIAAASLPAGTRLAQLGAFSTVDEARAEWDKVAADLAPLMTGKKRVIETAQSGGRTFYRLRVQGFADLADARRFCAALQAEGRLCTPAQAQG